MDQGLWIMDYRLWIRDYGLWIVDCGVWLVDYGLTVWISLLDTEGVWIPVGGGYAVCTPTRITSRPCVSVSELPAALRRPQKKNTDVGTCDLWICYF